MAANPNRRQKREDEACASERDEDVYTDPWFSSAAADEELKQFMEMQLRKLPLPNSPRSLS